MLFAAMWMDLEIVTLSEVSQTEGEISYDTPYMWNLKRNDTSELTKQRETDLENELMVAGSREEQLGEGIVREFGIDMHTLLI